MAATASKLSFRCYTGTHSRQHRRPKGKAEILPISSSGSVFLVSTYCCCCRIRIGCLPASCRLWVLHTQNHGSRHKGNSLNSGCCVLQLLSYCCGVGFYGCGTVAALENQRTSWLRMHLRAPSHPRDFIPIIIEIDYSAARVRDTSAVRFYSRGRSSP